MQHACKDNEQLMHSKADAGTMQVTTTATTTMLGLH